MALRLALRGGCAMVAERHAVFVSGGFKSVTLVVRYAEESRSPCVFGSRSSVTSGHFGVILLLRIASTEVCSAPPKFHRCFD